MGDVPALATRSQRAIADFVELWDELRALVENGEEPADVLDAVLARTGYRTELERTAEDDPQDASRLDNLTELVNVAREFTEQARIAAVAIEDESAVAAVDGGAAEPGSLNAFLERVSLVADADSVPDAGDGMVTLMTLHTAKGLEFPVVFCTGWEDGVFPHQRALGDPVELAEERRLAYVGITRARQRLYLSRAIIRSAWGQPMVNPASRFLDDVPLSLVDWRRTAPAERSAPVGRSMFGRRGTDGGLGGGSGGTGPGGAGERGRGARSAPYRSWEARPQGQVLSLEVGDRVSHDKYGLGTVIATDGSGPMANVTIDFGTGSNIRILLRGAPPMVKL
jgi:DNA helicase-2/ATP-dependent DNA helicase PcrA